jgi:hypothetical protein
MHELKLIVDLLVVGGMSYMRHVVSNTAEYGDLTRGPRVVDAHTRKELQKILKEIQSGKFAKEWIKEYRSGNKKFNRLRVGIGDPARGAVDHVLGRFDVSEQARLDELLDAAVDAVEAWARDGVSKAANRYNAFTLRPADETRLAPAGDVDGPPGPDGIRRTKTGWRRVLPRRFDGDR